MLQGVTGCSQKTKHQNGGNEAAVIDAGSVAVMHGIS
jgi:hypothetical protein